MPTVEELASEVRELKRELRVSLQEIRTAAITVENRLHDRIRALEATRARPSSASVPAPSERRDPVAREISAELHRLADLWDDRARDIRALEPFPLSGNEIAPFELAATELRAVLFGLGLRRRPDRDLIARAELIKPDALVEAKERHR